MADEKIPAPVVERDVEKELATQSSLSPHEPVVILKHTDDADEAMKAFAGHEGEILVLDEATNKKLLRKIDLHLMPVLPLQTAREIVSDALADSLHRLWPQLPRQSVKHRKAWDEKERGLTPRNRDYAVVRKHHGHQGGHWPSGQ